MIDIHGFEFEPGVQQVYIDGRPRFKPVVKIISKELFFDDEFAAETAEELIKKIQQIIDEENQP